MDDFLVTMLMNLVYEGSFHSMAPAMSMKHYPVTLIRPLCLVPEDFISRYAEEMDLVRQITPCPYEDTTKRSAMENTLSLLSGIHPEARQSMWHAIEKTWKL